MKGMRPVVVVDINLENAKNALLNAGVPESEIREAKTADEAADFIKAGKYVISDDSAVAIHADGVECVVDAIGVTEISTRSLTILTAYM